MTLDPPPNWKHADELERGENPARAKRQAEQQRIDTLANLLSEHEHDLSPHFWRKVAGRLVAFSPRVITLLSPPAPGIHRDLQQERTASLSDEDSILERLGEIERDLPQLEAERSKLRGFLRGMESVYAEHDPDERAADEDSDRIAQERRDAEAAAGMPKGMTA